MLSQQERAERHRAAQKAYRENPENREKCKAYRMAWRERQKEKRSVAEPKPIADRAAKKRAYYKQNREKLILKCRAYRAKKKADGGKVRVWLCEFCGDPARKAGGKTCAKPVCVTKREELQAAQMELWRNKRAGYDGEIWRQHRDMRRKVEAAAKPTTTFYELQNATNFERLANRVLAGEIELIPVSRGAA